MLSSASSSNFEILLVDDDKVVSLLHRNRLVNAGIDSQPKVFHDGREAFQYLLDESTKEKTFLVLLDLNMPVLNGWDFLEKLRSTLLSSKVHVIIVTSSIFAKDRPRAFEFEQVIGFFNKPLLSKHVEALKKMEHLQGFFD